MGRVRGRVQRERERRNSAVQRAFTNRKNRRKKADLSKVEGRSYRKKRGQGTRRILLAEEP